MVIRILIADRQSMFREVLRNLLESQPDFAVVADTDDGERLIHLVSNLQPDVILMDRKLQKCHGLEILREITALQTHVRPIMLTDAMAPGETVQALLWGARGMVLKDALTSFLFSSIRAVMAGEYWVSHGSIAEIVRNLCSLAELAEQGAQLQTRSLTPQQRQIIEAIASGSSNREIAQELRLSERTVKYHLTRIFNKFGVSGRMELARYSLRNEAARRA